VFVPSPCAIRNQTLPPADSVILFRQTDRQYPRETPVVSNPFLMYTRGLNPSTPGRAEKLDFLLVFEGTGPGEGSAQFLQIRGRLETERLALVHWRNDIGQPRRLAAQIAELFVHVLHLVQAVEFAELLDLHR
jgi:hypothetical protein